MPLIKNRGNAMGKEFNDYSDENLIVFRGKQYQFIEMTEEEAEDEDYSDCDYCDFHEVTIACRNSPCAPDSRKDCSCGHFKAV